MADQPNHTDMYWTSPHNWEDQPDFPDPEDITFHDTTMRDGEQQPGVVFTEEEKVELGKLYSEIGIDRIEPGLPVVSEDDKNALERLAKENLEADVFGFTRCVKSDVEVAVEADVDGVVMEIPSSEHLVNHAYDWSYDQAIEYAIESTQFAHEHGLDVSFFCVDSSRADPDDLINVLSRVVDEGHADSLNVVDSFGALSPEGMRALVNLVDSNFDLPLEVHAHNDFGLGVANTLAALEAGAEIAHTTVTGLGERIGNANFEETATSLKALYGQDLDLDFSRFQEAAERTSKASGVPIAQNKPIVGEMEFTFESGIVSDWWNKLEKKDMPLTIFPYHWDLVGQHEPKVKIGKMSGSGTVTYWCNRLGLEVPPEDEAGEIVQRIKEQSIEDKRLVSVEEFVDVYRDVMGLE